MYEGSTPPARWNEVISWYEVVMFYFCSMQKETSKPGEFSRISIGMTTPMESYRAAFRLTTDIVSREELIRQVEADPRLSVEQREDLLTFANSRRLTVYA